MRRKFIYIYRVVYSEQSSVIVGSSKMIFITITQSIQQWSSVNQAQWWILNRTNGVGGRGGKPSSALSVLDPSRKFKNLGTLSLIAGVHT